MNIIKSSSWGVWEEQVVYIIQQRALPFYSGQVHLIYLNCITSVFKQFEIVRLNDFILYTVFYSTTIFSCKIMCPNQRHRVSKKEIF